MRTRNMQCTLAMTAVGLSGIQAYAGLAFSEVTRYYAIGSATTAFSDTFEGYGALNLDFDFGSSNQHGDTYAKLNHESIINADRYKATTSLAITATESSPRATYTGGMMFIGSTLTIDQPTSVRFAFDVQRSSDKGFYGILLTDPTFVTTYLNVDFSESMHGSYTLDLAAGKYRMGDFLLMSGLEEQESGRWTFESTLTVSVIPAPATLALLAPATLLTTRRRRRE